MNYRFILMDGVPVPEPDLIRWAEWMETSPDRCIAFSVVGEGLQVSTVFLGVDMGLGLNDTADPILFETMVFIGEHPVYGFQERYRTLEEAMLGHERGVTFARLQHLKIRLKRRNFNKKVSSRPVLPPKNDMDLLDLDS